MNQRSVFAYQMAAADGATHAGLLVLVYDAIARDLARAAEAVRRKDIAVRCAASNHALLLVGHVEAWTDLIDDPGLSSSLRTFYAMLRSQILLLQAKPDDGAFENLARMVCETRASWQDKERSVTAIPYSATGPQRTQNIDVKSLRAVSYDA